MKKVITLIAALVFVLSGSNLVLAYEEAPRITDREIVERLSRLEEGQKSLEKRIADLGDSLNKRIDNLNESLNNRIGDTNNRIDDTNRRVDDLRSDMNKRFDILQWMFGLFISISLVILGFVLRQQWLMQRRVTIVETALETQRDEIAFFKELIEKLLPPKGVL